MKIVASAGREDVAMVYVVELSQGRLVECVESVQPPLPRDQKWVLLVSTLYGCPVGCQMCDAGGYYQGKPSAEEILAQVEFLVRQRYPDGRVPCRQFKIQFSRMGEPAYNLAVVEALRLLPVRIDAPGLMPSISTIAPAGRERFFDQLLEVKQALYPGGRFQFQFSLHSTDPAWRERLIPVKKWSFAEMAAYGERFYTPGDRKITLNFALAQQAPVDPAILLEHFDPDRFLIKITPLNPTYRAAQHDLRSYVEADQAASGGPVAEALQAAGYQVIVSIGELEENQIGSNCGQYIRTHLEACREPALEAGYSYALQDWPASGAT